MALASVCVVVASYPPLTSLNHLHLHVAEGIEYVHDHLHVGHHEHDLHYHHHRLPGSLDPPSGNGNGDSNGDSRDRPRSPSTVVSYAQAAQLRPANVELLIVSFAVSQRLSLAAQQPPQAGWFQPSSRPRAPPA